MLSVWAKRTPFATILFTNSGGAVTCVVLPISARVCMRSWACAFVGVRESAASVHACACVGITAELARNMQTEMQRQPTLLQPEFVLARIELKVQVFLSHPNLSDAAGIERLQKVGIGNLCDGSSVSGNDAQVNEG